MNTVYPIATCAAVLLCSHTLGQDIITPFSTTGSPTGFSVLTNAGPEVLDLVEGATLTFDAGNEFGHASVDVLNETAFMLGGSVTTGDQLPPSPVVGDGFFESLTLDLAFFANESGIFTLQAEMFSPRV